MKAEFIQTTKLTAVQFNPDEHPWHHSVQLDGKIPDYEMYSCIIPCDRVYTIYPGDWIVVDDMDNAKSVISERFFEMMGIRRVVDVPHQCSKSIRTCMDTGQECDGYREHCQDRLKEIGLPE